MTVARIVVGVGILGYCASTTALSQSYQCDAPDCRPPLAVVQRAPAGSLEVFDITETPRISTRPGGLSEAIALNVTVKPTPPGGPVLTPITSLFAVSVGMGQEAKDVFAVSGDSSAKTDPSSTSTADFKVTITGEAPQRPKGLMPLYQVYVGLSAADGVQTWLGVRRGAVEGNPALPFIARNPLTLIGVKAGASVSTIYFADRLRRRHPRQAVVMMAAINGALTWVVWHNAEVLRKLK